MTYSKKIQMVDLKGQYQKIKTEVDQAIQNVIDSTQFIKGEAFHNFEINLASYLSVNHLIGCANGTDALQIALMALGLNPGDEIIVPSFSYAATAEVAALLRLKPVFVDVHYDSFNIDEQKIEEAITSETKAIIPVHLFGQQANMLVIKEIADKYGLYIIEDNAQSIGCSQNNTDSKSLVGHISCTSFFPSKNLGCFGDGGAIYTQDQKLADRIRMIASHGQSKKYIHDIVGVNSRLDTIQAAILDVKLKHLDAYIEKRKWVAEQYNQLLDNCEEIMLPQLSGHSDHIFHQYSIKVKANKRDALAEYLKSKGIPFAIYYPIPLHQQKAFRPYVLENARYPISEKLSDEVISLPIHTELTMEEIKYICQNITYFFNK